MNCQPQDSNQTTWHWFMASVASRQGHWGQGHIRYIIWNGLSLDNDRPYTPQFIMAASSLSRSRVAWTLNCEVIIDSHSSAIFDDVSFRYSRPSSTYGTSFYRATLCFKRGLCCRPVSVCSSVRRISVRHVAVISTKYRPTSCSAR